MARHRQLLEKEDDVVIGRHLAVFLTVVLADEEDLR